MDEAARTSLAAAVGVNILSLALLLRWGRSRGEPYCSVTIVATFVLGMEFVLRPLAIFVSEQTGWDPTTVRQVNSGDSSSIVFASVQSVVGVTLFCVAMVVGACLFAGVDGSSDMSRFRSASSAVSKKPVLTLYTWLLSVTLAVTLLVGLRYGNFGDALAGTFGRSQLDSGYIYSLVNVAPLAVLLVLHDAPKAQLTRGPLRTGLILVSAASGCVYLLILGGRVEFLTLSIAAIVLMRGRFGRPAVGALVIGALTLTLASGVYRVVTREALYAENIGTPPSALVSRSLSDPLSLITRGDVSAFDKMTRIHASSIRTISSTYEAALRAPLPGRVEGYAGEGGSRTFTRLYLPDRYLRSATYEGVSLPGEAMMNLGPWTAGLPLALAGLALGSLTRFRRRRLGFMSLALGTGLLPTLLRADAFNTVALASSLSLALAFVVFVGKVFTFPEARSTQKLFVE
jgi:hypothetical protein